MSIDAEYAGTPRAMAQLRSCIQSLKAAERSGDINQLAGAVHNIITAPTGKRRLTQAEFDELLSAFISAEATVSRVAPEHQRSELADGRDVVSARLWRWRKAAVERDANDPVGSKLMRFYYLLEAYVWEAAIAADGIAQSPGAILVDFERFDDPEAAALAMAEVRLRVA